MSNFLARHKNEIKISCATLGELFGQKIALEVQFESTYIFQSWPVISISSLKNLNLIFFAFFKVFLKGKNNIFLMWCWACTGFFINVQQKGKKVSIVISLFSSRLFRIVVSRRIFFFQFFCIKNERGSVAVIYI